ncbi:predicted protein [Sparassis crispa]|uniref:histone acetyltransferase n=1 Tax=Sparassis crispa TaxID=139825 RepID=A0A401GM02_9APHY|nr:predicted protein [Sparassis crispa]GBE83200.1 predicted protein [Sparassis crispa]
MILRDALLASLSRLPGTREFHIHVLLSSPRKHSGLFPYAHPRPRAYLQDLLVLLSEQQPNSPRVLVTAIEASIYNVPVTSSGVLYISKVDSSGHATLPSPTTSLVRALLAFYGDPTTRPLTADHFWIQLFARAQGQYLFPNSAEFSGKSPLTGIQLCAWWQRVLSDVATQLMAQNQQLKLGLYYVLPGLSEVEAVHSLDAARTRPLATDCPWTYGHPYSQMEIPLPCPVGKTVDERSSLGHLIPSFDDDPKSRFMDEIAHTTDSEGVKSPKTKRPKTSHHPSGASRDDKDDEDDAHEARHGEIERVSPDEFWERMSFRQECIAGVVTAFFAMGLSTPIAGRSVPASSPLAPQPGQVAPRMVRRVVATLLNHHEFSTTERAVRATETLEEAVKGLCEDLKSAAAPLQSHRTVTPERETTSVTLEVPRTPPRRVGGYPSIADVSPNPFDEPVASLETYRSYIYGTISVSNASLLPKDRGDVAGRDTKEAPAQTVTVLAVRKKRKVAS